MSENFLLVNWGLKKNHGVILKDIVNPLKQFFFHIHIADKFVCFLPIFSFCDLTTVYCLLCYVMLCCVILYLLYRTIPYHTIPYVVIWGRIPGASSGWEKKTKWQSTVQSLNSVPLGLILGMVLLTSSSTTWRMVLNWRAGLLFRYLDKQLITGVSGN